MLKASNNKYVRVDHETGELMATGSHRIFADAFAAVSTSPVLMESRPTSPYSNYRHRMLADLQSPDGKGGKGALSSADGIVTLKVCQQNLWLSTAQKGESLSSVASLVVKPDLDDTMPPSSIIISDQVSESESESSLRGHSGRKLRGAKSGGNLFQIKEVPQLKGVNLGGMFVPEVWMNPSFYNGTMMNGTMTNQPVNDQGTPLGWGGSLCRMVDWNREETEKRMAWRFDNWFTEQDFIEIAAAGFNSVRLPIGYWNIIQDPHHAYAPSDLNKSLHKIDWVFTMAQKYDLLVLLDLHGAPGSQNGQDHSGCSKAEAWDHPDNQRLSREAIRAMAERYGRHSNLWGFELLNEPSDFYSHNNHQLLLAFYKDSYAIIREHSDEAVVVFNELYVCSIAS